MLTFVQQHGMIFGGAALLGGAVLLAGADRIAPLLSAAWKAISAGGGSPVAPTTLAAQKQAGFAACLILSNIADALDDGPLMEHVRGCLENLNKLRTPDARRPTS